MFLQIWSNSRLCLIPASLASVFQICLNKNYYRSFQPFFHFYFEGVFHPKWFFWLCSQTSFISNQKNSVTWRVEIVSLVDSNEGEIQTIKQILLSPLKESRRTRVSFELRNGICVLLISVNAEIQWPNVDKLPLIEVSSTTRISFSSWLIFFEIINFSDPAKSTSLIYHLRQCWTIFTFEVISLVGSLGSGCISVNWNIEWLLELFVLAWVLPVTRF